MRAADQAARVYANAEAILHLDLAARRLQRLPEGPDRDRRMLDVALRHAHSLYFLGRFRESVDVLLPHEARLSRLNDAGARGAVLVLARAHVQPARRSAARRRERARGDRGGDAAPAIRRRSARPTACSRSRATGRARPNDGIAHGTKAVRCCSRTRDQRWWLGMTHFYLAMNHLLTGDFEARAGGGGPRGRGRQRDWRSAAADLRRLHRRAGSRRRAANADGDCARAARASSRRRIASAAPTPR